MASSSCTGLRRIAASLVPQARRPRASPISVTSTPHTKLFSTTTTPRFAAGKEQTPVKFDQTKKNNDASSSATDSHQKQAEMTGSDQGRDHPMKQADPQKTPTSSTGIQREGSQGVAQNPGKKG